MNTFLEYSQIYFSDDSPADVCCTSESLIKHHFCWDAPFSDARWPTWCCFLRKMGVRLSIGWVLQLWLGSLRIFPPNHVWLGLNPPVPNFFSMAGKSTIFKLLFLISPAINHHLVRGFTSYNNVWWDQRVNGLYNMPSFSQDYPY